MKELSLFSGVGGGLLGTHLLGWVPVGYVENNDYCQQVLAKRISEGYLRPAPIWTDVREFVESGCAAEYRGFADVVTAGFPCQPFSRAGQRRGADDERNMWPATIAVLGAVRPKFALLENVPGLIDEQYLPIILADLAALGMDARWGVVSGENAGAPHVRARLWIVAYSKGWRPRADGRQKQQSSWPPSSAQWKDARHVVGGRGGERDTPNAESKGRKGGNPEGHTSAERRSAEHGRWLWESDWWPVESPVQRVADGVANRLERFSAIGNGQVPAVVVAAWRLLTEGIEDATVSEETSSD